MQKSVKTASKNNNVANLQPFLKHVGLKIKRLGISLQLLLFFKSGGKSFRKKKMVFNSMTKIESTEVPKEARRQTALPAVLSMSM